MSNETGKINNASFSVLCTMIALFEKNLTMDELIKTLNKMFPRTKFNNFVVSKYINTCRSCGIDIYKIDGKYALINFPIGEKFSEDEAKLLFKLKDYSEDLKVTKIADDVQSFIEKLHLTNYKAGIGLKTSKNYRIIKLFNAARHARCNIKIYYYDGNVVDCSPREVFVSDGKIFFKTSNKQGLQNVNPDDIQNIKITEENNLDEIIYEDVVYELKGKLAKRYQLRENEEVLRYKKNGSIVIVNKYESKTDLLRRLMRYDSSCKLLKPQSYVEDFKAMIQGAISNYES